MWVGDVGDGGGGELLTKTWYGLLYQSREAKNNVHNSFASACPAISTD